MIKKEKKYTACPKCLGNMKVRKDGSYKCRLCKSVYTHEKYIASVSKMLLSDINRWNESESKMADVRKLNMLCYNDEESYSLGLIAGGRL